MTNDENFVHSGTEFLDYILKGGFKSGKLYVIRNVYFCDTRFMLSMFFASAAAKSRISAIICSYEKTKDAYLRYFERYDVHTKYLSISDECLTENELESFVRYRTEKDDAKILIIDNPIFIKTKKTYSEILNGIAIKYNIAIVLIDRGDTVDDPMDDNEEETISDNAYCVMKFDHIGKFDYYDRYMISIERLGNTIDVGCERIHIVEHDYILREGFVVKEEFQLEDVDEKMTVLEEFFLVNCGPIDQLKPETQKVVKEIKTQLVKDGWTSEKAEVLVMPDDVYDETYPILDELDFKYGEDNDEIDRDDDTLEAYFEGYGTIDCASMLWVFQQLGDKVIQKMRDYEFATSPNER